MHWPQIFPKLHDLSIGKFYIMSGICNLVNAKSPLLVKLQWVSQLFEQKGSQSDVIGKICRCNWTEITVR